MKTAMLLGLTSAAVIVVGSRSGTVGWWVAGVVVVGLNVYVFFGADTGALKAMRAYPVSEAGHPRLHHVVREVASAAHIPVPRVYVSPTPAATAFATGRNPWRAAICCTEGLLKLLDDRELRAVIAHEATHIKRRDTSIAAAAGAVAGMLMALVGLSFLATGEDDDGPGVISGLAALILGPLAAGVVAMAVQRAREYEADAEAAQLVEDPLAMASALRKLDSATRELVLPAERAIMASSHMMITRPLHRKGIARLFATHPPVAERVARLEQRAGYRR